MKFIIVLALSTSFLIAGCFFYVKRDLLEIEQRFISSKIFRSDKSIGITGALRGIKENSVTIFEYRDGKFSSRIEIQFPKERPSESFNEIIMYSNLQTIASMANAIAGVKDADRPQEVASLNYFFQGYLSEFNQKESMLQKELNNYLRDFSKNASAWKDAESFRAFSAQISRRHPLL